MPKVSVIFDYSKLLFNILFGEARALAPALPTHHRDPPLCCIAPAPRKKRRPPAWRAGMVRCRARSIHHPVSDPATRHLAFGPIELKMCQSTGPDCFCKTGRLNKDFGS